MTIDKDQKYINLKYFVGHKPPAFEMWPGYQYFDLGGPADLCINELDGFEDNADKVLSEYYSLFKLREKLLKKEIFDGQITICQHRRFVLNERIGEKSINQPFAQVISVAEVSGVTADMLLPKKNSYLIGTPYVSGGNLIEQYQMHHHLRDLLRFSSDIIDAGLLTELEVNEFLNLRYFIPAPSCGVFEISLFLNIFEVLEKTAMTFHAQGYRKRGGYQGRVTSFILERLNSYFLVKYLKKKGIDFGRCIGYTTVINENVFIKAG